MGRRWSRATAWTALSCQLIVSKSASAHTGLGHARPVLTLRRPARPAGRASVVDRGTRAGHGDEVRLVGRRRCLAERISLRAIARPAARKPGPVVTRVRSRTVEDVDLVGLIVFAVATSGRYGTGLMAGDGSRWADGLDGNG